MNIKTNLLTPYEFNEEFFEDIQGTDYDALKEDIKQNNIKVDLHITKSNVILCGHQRWKIAKDIGLEDVPVKIIDIDETDTRKVKEYVIKDNLLRRQLSREQTAILRSTLSEVYETDRVGMKYNNISCPDSGHENKERDDVLTKTAKDTGVSKSTIALDRKYTEIVKKSPELRKKKFSEIVNNYEIKNDKVMRKNTRIEINLDRLKRYDSNMFYSTSEYHENRFGDEVICIDSSKDYYPTVTRLSCFFHSNGQEFSLREYARVQDFPEDFIFVGIPQQIKHQIGEAVSPKMSEYIINKHIKGETYIELFAGCGGFSVGAHKLNKKCKWCIDFNKYSGHSYKLNFPDTEVYIGDIIDCNEKKIHKEVGEIDFILGGPPCQGFSTAGKLLGFKEDTRNQLYLEYLRFVKKFKPKQFIMENVVPILKYKDEIIKDFEKIGYNVIVEKVNGLDIGMKQQRVRVFFIGERRDKI